MNKLSVQYDSSRLSAKENQLVERALIFAQTAHAGQLRKIGDDYIAHPIAVAETLADWGMDGAAIAAGLLHDTVEDCDVTLEQLAEQFGETVATLVDGVTKLGQVEFVPQEGSSRQAISNENLRKLLLAMTKDLRVILVKLADRRHNLLTLRYLKPADQRRIARETLEIFAPLADRLGMGALKSELEDLSFKYADPDAYKEVEQQLSAHMKGIGRYLLRLKRFTTEQLEAGGLTGVSIEGRPKHYYSVYKKLAKADGDIDKIYDLAAIRVMVPTESDCYQALGIIHQHFKPLIHRIKDYIAVPKPNGYRSLHTTVFALDGRITEFQIRTPAMHEEAEKGLAAHFFYDQQKSGRGYTKGQASLLPDKLNWVAEIADLHKQAQSGQDLVDSLKVDLFVDRIFVFSPKGDLYDLPEGATPVDFAFAIHSDIGLRTAGAKVNGRMVTLDHRLDNRDVVEVMTRKQAAPNRDWLNFVKTAGARNRIRAWFRGQSRDKNVTIGREAVEQEIKAWGYKRLEEIPARQVDALLDALSYKTIEDVLAAVGEGMMTVAQVIRRLFPAEIEAPKPVVRPTKGTGKVVIASSRNLSYHLSPCCHPAFPQAIVGYITRGSGVTVHARGCGNLPDEPDRLAECHWELVNGTHSALVVALGIAANNRIGLLRDLSGLISSMGINISKISSENNEADTEAAITIEMEVPDLYVLAQLIKKIERQPGILSVVRSDRL